MAQLAKNASTQRGVFGRRACGWRACGRRACGVMLGKPVAETSQGDQRCAGYEKAILALPA